MSFLTDAELVVQTKRTQPAAQIRMLIKLRIAHRVVDGKPVVTWAAVEGRPGEQKSRGTINWEAVE